MKKGFFSIEGIEATGKTTVANMVVIKLKKDGFKVVTTREPGGIESAETIRNTIMDDSMKDISPMTELLLFMAARKEHLDKKIIPLLNSGHIVITDRFLHSSVAYQGGAKGLGIDTVFDMNKSLVDDYMPCTTFLIDVPVEISLERKMKVEEQNRLDKMSVDFYENVRSSFLCMADNDKFGRIVKIDGTLSMEEIADCIYESIIGGVCLRVVG